MTPTEFPELQGLGKSSCEMALNPDYGSGLFDRRLGYRNIKECRENIKIYKKKTRCGVRGRWQELRSMV